MRLLSKSRFRLALECPTKLFYTKKLEYSDHADEDTFMQALAKGGFQVEELARRYYGGGHMIREQSSQPAAKETRNWLQQEEITLYEAAFLHGHLLARTDILQKRGKEIHILEVKAKSVDGNKMPDETFLGIRDKKIKEKWRDYLWDLAFQTHVVRLCHPKAIVRSFLVLADTSVQASRDGLNQLFKIDPSKSDNLRDAIVVPEGLKREDLGDPILKKLEVTEIVWSILEGKETYNGTGAFLDLVAQFSEAFAQDKEIVSPVSKQCKDCTFYATPEEQAKGHQCGFSRCWTRETGLTGNDLKEPKVYDVWYLGKTEERLLAERTFLARDIREDDFTVKPDPRRLTRTERQWVQIEKIQQKDDTPYLRKEELAEAISWHHYPLHFIDFETYTSTLPFHRGRRPYEQIAFQYSHHVLHEDGRIEHRDQFIVSEPGVWPNYDFVRALKSSLEQDEGTIFRYADHEITVLRQIYDQLLEDEQVVDRLHLLTFLGQITKKGKHVGSRNMVDLKKIIEHYYYHSHTNGSISLKAVLPAMIQSIPMLKEKYSCTIGDAGIHSLNQQEDWRWICPEKEGGLDPYQQLPLLFKGHGEPEGRHEAFHLP